METLGDILECPICLETMVAPIRQCKKGHSICDECTKRIKCCPLCKAPITSARNYQLEKVIANLKDMEISKTVLPCKYARKGCKTKVRSQELPVHESECRYRDHTCEGATFLNWNCEWVGDYEDIIQHFKNQHVKHTGMEYHTTAHLKVDLSKEFSDLQIIPYYKGMQLFWYKHKIDIWRERAYWLIQYVGPKTEASKYFYKFTLKNGPLRMLTIKEVCESDSTNNNELFDSGKCVSVPFNVLKNYLTADHDVAFTFRIGEVKEKLESKNQNINQFVNNIQNANSGSKSAQPPQANLLQGQQVEYHPGPLNGPQNNPNFAIVPQGFQPNSPFQGMIPGLQFPFNTCSVATPQFMQPFIFQQYPHFPNSFIPPPEGYH